MPFPIIFGGIKLKVNFHHLSSDLLNWPGSFNPGHSLGRVQCCPNIIPALYVQPKIRSWNDTAENIYGWKAEEVIGKQFREVTALEYLDEKREQVLDEVDRKGVWRGEVIQSRKDGKRIFVQTTLSSIKDKEGVRIGLVGVNRDITERKVAELPLARQRQRIAACHRRCHDYRPGG